MMKIYMVEQESHHMYSDDCVHCVIASFKDREAADAMVTDLLEESS